MIIDATSGLTRQVTAVWMDTSALEALRQAVAGRVVHSPNRDLERLLQALCDKLVTA